MKRANTSFPVPLSPVIRTVASLAATRHASSTNSTVRGSSATKGDSWPLFGAANRLTMLTSTSASKGFTM